MKRTSVLLMLFLMAITLLAQYPRNKVVFEDGTGTW